MNTIFRVIVHLAITSKVIAISFEILVKTLPADVPQEIKAMMLDMHKKHPEEFTMPDLDDVTLTDVKTTSPIVTAPAQSDHITIESTTVKINTKKVLKPVIPARRNLGTATPKESPPPSLETTTPKLPETGTETEPCQVSPVMPVPVPMQMPMAMPVYARVPIMMPMRSYFEPVIHDHPPLYKIKKMIEKDEKKWQKENKGKDCDVSVEITYSEEYTDSDDSDSDTSSESDYYVDSDYYSDVIKIGKNH